MDSHISMNPENKKLVYFYIYFGQKNIVVGQHVKDHIMEESLQRANLKGGSRTWENIGYPADISPFPWEGRMQVGWVDACVSQ